MNSEPTPRGAEDRAFLSEVAAALGRTLRDDEASLALKLRPEKSAAIIARELDAAPVTDPKKIRPEHSDVADE